MENEEYQSLPEIPLAEAVHGFFVEDEEMSFNSAFEYAEWLKDYWLEDFENAGEQEIRDAVTDEQIFPAVEEGNFCAKVEEYFDLNRIEQAIFEGKCDGEWGDPLSFELSGAARRTVERFLSRVTEILIDEAPVCVQPDRTRRVAKEELIERSLRMWRESNAGGIREGGEQ